jgi:filamentous hemagglutinin family protein
MYEALKSLLFKILPLATLGAIAAITSARAQITPDDSLGAESSTVTPETINKIPSDLISGGAARGENLFHSFKDFNIGEGRGAYFANSDGIGNILSRVTGGNASTILGKLGVLGNANLFLINPAGILFGQNASLDVKGSFVGTTADSVVFGDGFEFSASDPSAPPLLTINIPNGLRFRDNSGDIVNRSIAPDPATKETQAGDIAIDATDKVSFDGVGANGLPSGIYNSVFDRGVGNTGKIQITTSDLSLTNRGTILSNLSGTGNLGDITINASNNISLDGTGITDVPNGSSITNQIAATGSGSTGNISRSRQFR